VSPEQNLSASSTASFLMSINDIAIIDRNIPASFIKTLHMITPRTKPSRLIYFIVLGPETGECIISRDYVYYTVDCPWLQVKLLRLLQFFPAEYLIPYSSSLNRVVEKILATTPMVRLNYDE
jgi:hypothetical protein